MLLNTPTIHSVVVVVVGLLCNVLPAPPPAPQLLQLSLQCCENAAAAGGVVLQGSAVSSLRLACQSTLCVFSGRTNPRVSLDS